MKLINLSAKLLFLFLGLTTIVSCTKEGPVGPAGTNGTNGNANVKTYSYTPTFALQTSGIYANAYTTTITNTEITQAIIEKGVISVYNEVNIGGLQTQTQLPFTTPGASPTLFWYVASVNQITIIIQKADGTAPLAPTNTIKYKVALTAGN